MALPTPSPAPERSRPWLTERGWGYVLILGATFAAYAPVLHAGFIWNDSDYVTAKALSGWSGLGWIWFRLGATQQYYPLLHSAFWLERGLWGDSAGAYHAVNILWHGLAACLLTALLREIWRVSAAAGPGRRTGEIAAVLAGLLFALHPVAVESAAWISEQKNTLSTVFYLLAALTYLRFDRSRSSRAYAAALALFAAAVLTTSVAATLPVSLLALLWWRRGRLTWRGEIRPLLPWAALGAADGLLTSWVEQAYVGAHGASFDLPGPARAALAARAAWFYLGKLLAPARLVFVYPRLPAAGGPAAAWLPLVAAAVVLAWLWQRRRAGRAPVAAAVLFLAALFPVLGFFNVFGFLFSYVADHWQYLAILPAAAFAAGACRRWQERWSAGHAAAGAWRHVPLALGFALAALLGAASSLEARHYAAPEAFYRELLARNPACWMAHENLGTFLGQTGRAPEARREYEASLRLRPDDSIALSGLGALLLDQGETAQAINRLTQSFEGDPSNPDSHYLLGVAFARQRRTDDAVEEFHRALALNPDFFGARLSLAAALADQGKFAEAANQYRAAAYLDPGSFAARLDLARALGAAGSWDQSLGEFFRAVQLQPASAEAHNYFGEALARSGRLDEAMAELRTALRLRPGFAPAEINLGNACLLAKRPAEAAKHYRAALKIDPGSRQAKENLRLAERSK